MNAGMKMANTLFLKEISNGVLISLSDLISRLPVSEIKYWRFHQVTLNFGAPFGIPFDTFGRIMRASMGSITVPDEMFREFLLEDRQFIDGYIHAFEKDAVDPLFTIEAFDASFWLIHTSSKNLTKQLLTIGFQPDKGD